MDEVFVTTLNTDNYLVGVLVLALYIKQYCVHKLVVLVSDDLKHETYNILENEKITYLKVDKLDLEPYIDKLESTNGMFSHWKNTFFKLKVFDLVQYKKVVYIDSDMMVLGSLDELFECEHMTATVAGKSFPGNEHFREINSGLFVFIPEDGLSKKLMMYIPLVGKEKTDFGDQDVLAKYYNDWEKREELHLSECYNVFWNYYDYYYNLHGEEGIKVIHFIGRNKPWMLSKQAAMIEYLKCLLTRRIHSIGILKRYRADIKRMMSQYN